MLLKSLWIAPVGYYSAAGTTLKIMFGTGSCKVFALDSNGGGSDPEILLKPEDTIIGSCKDDYLPKIGLYEESLVPLGRTIEDMIFSSPTTDYRRRPLCRGLVGLPRARSRALRKWGLCRGPAPGDLGKDRPSANK